MLKKRFSEIMMQLRIKATKLAYKAGENVKLRNSNQFNIIHKYPPESVPINIWRDICSAWYTKAWLSKSKCGSPNRNIANINGRSSRHTGGSMGFDEHLENWRRTYGREPTWKELFLQTHLTKECKEKLRKCEISIYDMNDLKFCTNRSKEGWGGGTWRRCMIFTGRTSLIVLMTLRCGLVCPQEVIGHPGIWGRIFRSALHGEWDIIIF
ncbi:hypothetical protein Hdeb2414_s0014g00425801 [Helianthus debilis subsp. tardiflorus]